MTIPSNRPLSLVSGGAGFVGVNLVPRLLAEGRRVVVADNLSRGQRAYLAPFAVDRDLVLMTADLSVRADCERAFDVAAGFGRLDEVWHLAANSDIPAGVADPDIDLRDTFMTSFEVLHAMRRHGVARLLFASSSAIYGDLGDRELHESIGPLLPISNYGAMKLASEAQISAAAESGEFSAHLFRFPNVVGVPATHGVILDFVRKLLADRATLEVLGDGTQQKSYLHVSDLVEAMLYIRALPQRSRATPINIGPVDEGVRVRWIAEQVVARLAPGAKIRYGSGSRGWVGDVPRFRYSTAALRALGWAPRLGSEGAVLRAIDEIASAHGA